MCRHPSLIGTVAGPTPPGAILDSHILPPTVISSLLADPTSDTESETTSIHESTASHDSEPRVRPQHRHSTASLGFHVHATVNDNPLDFRHNIVLTLHSASESFGEQVDRIETLQQSLDKFQATAADEMKEVKERLGTVGGEVKEVKERLGTRLGAVEGEVKEMKERLGAVEGEVRSLREDMNNLTTTVAKLETTVAQLVVDNKANNALLRRLLERLDMQVPASGTSTPSPEARVPALPEIRVPPPSSESPLVFADTSSLSDDDLAASSSAHPLPSTSNPEVDRVLSNVDGSYRNFLGHISQLGTVIRRLVSLFILTSASNYSSSLVFQQSS